MNIFDKRPLSLILCIILGGFSLCFIKSNVIFAIILSLSVIALIIFSFYKKFKSKKILKILAIAFIIGAVTFRIFFGLFFYPDKYNDEKVVINANVIDVEQTNEFLKTLTVKTDSINDECLSKYKLIVYIWGYSEEILSGNEIRLSGKLKSLSEASDSYNVSKGISGYVTAEEFVIENEGQPPISYHFEKIRENIAVYSEKISDKDTAALLSALLLGERDELSPSLNLNFQRSGITHILALSGMHLVLLSGVITFIFKILRINKKISCIASIAFSLLFMALVGFPSSVVRAGSMLIISTIVYLLTGCKDNITSLLLAFTLILLVQPYSIFDLSLWLSVLSTLGILVCAEYIDAKYDPKMSLSKLMFGLRSSLLFSLFAIAATYAIAVIFFDCSSIFAPIATLVVGFISNIFIYFGLVVLAVGSFIPIGGILGYIRAAIEAVVAAFASVPYASFSVSSVFIKILGIILTVALFFFFIIKTKRRKLFVTVIASLYLFINIFGIAITVDTKSEESLKYQNCFTESMLVTSNDEAYFIDMCDDGTNTGYQNAEYLYSENICVIDNYCVLSYSQGLVKSISVTMSRIKTNKLLLPLPKNSEEELLLSELISETKNFDVKIELYDPNEEILLGNFKLLMISRTEYNFSPKTLSFAISYNDKIYGYASASAFEYSKLAESLLYTSEFVIVGSYGDELSEPFMLDLTSDKLKEVTISTDWALPEDSYSELKVRYQKETEIIP